MLTTKTIKAIATPVVVSWMVGIMVTTAAQVAGAEFTRLPAKLQSTGPCYFTEQLQNSASVRKQYSAKLVKVLGRSTSGNSVEEMYSNIQPASYREEEEPALNIWGFENKTSYSRRTAEIDPLSADCLGCHDGVGAVSVAAVLKNNPFNRSHSTLPGSDHPIGMDYAQYATANRGEYKSVFNSKMIFVNGKVGCLTCHDPLNAEKGHLVMSDRGSALCLTCHGK